MPDTLPTYTRTLDDAFVSTWYEIRDEAVDNILDGTPVWNVLLNSGSFTPQVGGEIITRTIQYGKIDAEDIEKGDTMTSGDPDLDTMGIWNWKSIAVNIQRSMHDDQKNNGPSKIKDYVGRRITAARDGLEQKLETNLHSAFKTVETGKIFQGLNDLIPPRANRTSGTYGTITRASAYNSGSRVVEKPTAAATNPWWGPKYMSGVSANLDVDLHEDMKKLYNGVHNNQAAPNLIVSDLTIFEAYEDFAIDISQIIKDETTRLADLGFEVLRFKGKPMLWSENIASETLFMLNTDFIEIVYDPEFWFEMTDWKPGGALEFDRAAQIVAFCNMVSTQLRRHARLEYS